MEVFTPTRVSIDCQCGGRHSRIPEVVTRHHNTKKHKTWEFKSLCVELLGMTSRGDKVKCLIRMRDLLRSGRVW